MSSRPAAGPPVMDFDDIYPENVPTLYDHDADPVERFTHRWTREDRRGVLLVATLIVVAVVCYRLGELSAMGWFS
jgi:hypothetical protein